MPISQLVLSDGQCERVRQVWPLEVGNKNLWFGGLLHAARCTLQAARGRSSIELPGVGSNSDPHDARCCMQKEEDE